MIQVRELHPPTTEVLTLTGPFDRRMMPGLQVLILLAQKTAHHHLILDCSQVTNIDSGSFQRFFSWYRTMKAEHLLVSLVKPPPRFGLHSICGMPPSWFKSMPLWRRRPGTRRPIHKRYPFLSGIGITVCCLIHSSNLSGSNFTSLPILI